LILSDLHPHNPNIKQLLAVALKLQPLLEHIAFVGGCVTGLLVTDPAASPVRPTLDVDAIVEVATYAEYMDLENRLRQLGFAESREIICRWISSDLILDLMPTDQAILGFSNPWYRLALEKAIEVRIGDLSIRLISGPYFLATKIIAFHNRGKNDYVTSRDMEDIVTVIDGRPEIVEEVSRSNAELRNFLGNEFSSLLHHRDFSDALHGHLLPDVASQSRFRLVLDRMQQIAMNEGTRGPA
jgi:predicted nucleotidyltransferase